MRTRTLLVAAALTVAGIAAAQAQSNVYSVNVVGYYNIVVPTGGAQNNLNRYRLATLQLKANGIANPTLNNTLTNVTVGAQVHTWGVGGWSGLNEYLGQPDGWESDVAIPYGTGFFIKNPLATDVTVTVVGEVMQGVQTVTYGTGLNPRGPLTPQAGGLTTVHNWTQVGDRVYVWNPNNGNPGSWALINEYLGDPDGWENGEPTVPVGGAVMVSSATGGTWTRTFSVP